MALVPLVGPEAALIRRALQVQQQRASHWVEVAAHASVVAAHGKRQGNTKPAFLNELRDNVEKLEADIRQFNILRSRIDTARPELAAALAASWRSLDRSKAMMLESLTVLEGLRQPTSGSGVE
jgi:hypothetical protein